MKSEKVKVKSEKVKVKSEKVTNEIVVYQPNEVLRLDVRLENETVWLNQLQMAELFGVKLNTINYHIKEILKSGELAAEATIRKIRIVQKEGGREVVRPVDFNNLDMIIKQYGGLTIKTSTHFHDRFLIIDDRRLYLVGASLKDLGAKCFAFTQLKATEIAGIKSRV